MTKNEFLTQLEGRLEGLPDEDIKRSLDYYGEMIDDRLEDGMDEAQAVADIGSMDSIVAEILADVPLQKLVKRRVKPKRALKGLEIALLVLGSPVWASLLLAAAIVIFALYIVLWSVVISLYAVFISFAAAVAAGIFDMCLTLFKGAALQSAMYLGLALVCAGLTILFFHIGNLAAKGAAILGKKILIGIKKCFI